MPVRKRVASPSPGRKRGVGVFFRVIFDQYLDIYGTLIGSHVLYWFVTLQWPRVTLKSWESHDLSKFLHTAETNDSPALWWSQPAATAAATYMTFTVFIHAEDIGVGRRYSDHFVIHNACVCMCVSVLHDNQLTHTDLKPQNILFVNSVMWYCV